MSVSLSPKVLRGVRRGLRLLGGDEAGEPFVTIALRLGVGFLELEKTEKKSFPCCLSLYE